MNKVNWDGNTTSNLANTQVDFIVTFAAPPSPESATVTLGANYDGPITASELANAWNNAKLNHRAVASGSEVHFAGQVVRVEFENPAGHNNTVVPDTGASVPVVQGLNVSRA